MSVVASRDLRNHTADVLRQVADGGRVTITVHGAPVAEIRPVQHTQPRFFSRAQLIELLTTQQADAALAEQLDQLSGEYTDDLDPL